MIEETWLQWNELELLVRVLVAMVLGGVVGWEREAADKPAGLRTHIMIAGTAALLVSLGDTFAARAAAAGAPGVVHADPIRLVEAVVAGIGFLGAGTILRNRSQGVEGLTTAAGILFTAGLGVTVGLELWVLAVSLALCAVIVLHLLSRLSRRINPKST
jgi:putative Mg2+ transporter-C (MgtC) family protein